VRTYARSVLLALALGASGAAIGALVYLSLNPVLEESTGFLRELQGPLWNLIPLLVLVGIGLGFWLGRPRGPQD
jgi:hypothetical protein